MRTCSGCGAAVQWAFCTKCGRPVSDAAAQPPLPTSAPTPVSAVDATIGVQSWRPEAGEAPLWERTGELYRSDTVLASAVPRPVAPAQDAYPSPYPTPYAAPTPARSKAPVVAGVLGAVVLAVAGGLLVPQVLESANRAVPTTRAQPSDQPAGSAAAAPKPAVPSITSTTQTTQTTQTAPAAPASCPPGSTTCAQPLPMSGFVMVLESRIKSANPLPGVQALAQSLAAGGVTPRVVDSSLTNGMNPGFWVVGTGPYTTQAEAEASCASVGRTVGPDCYVREAVQAAALASRADLAPWTDGCRQVSAPDVEGCVAVYEFLQRYAALDNAKSMTRAEIGNWWKEPGTFYGADLTLDQLTAALTQPSPPGTSYGQFALTGMTFGVRSERWVTVTEARVTLPYTKAGVPGTAAVRFLVTAGTGANRFRITQVDEPS